MMISIAMATYNGGRFIREQLDSILRQTVQEFELVVCDDCSTDDTWDILMEYARRDKRIRPVRNENNMGFLANFQKAMRLCKGEFIALSDQDDIWMDNHLEVLYNNIGENLLVEANSELMDIHGNSMNVLISEQRNINYKYTKSIEIATTMALLRSWTQGASMMIKKGFLDIVLPFPKGVVFHDGWMALLACAKNSIVYVETPVTKYRQHGDNTSGTNYHKKHIILTWLNRRMNPHALPDRLAMCKALVERVPDMSPEMLALMKDAIIYHTRKRTFIGRLRNISIEMKYRKLIYSIK